MSTKKDNFQLSDKKLMKLAISLAENQKYFTGTNPPVGCVIARNNKIISYGVTGKNGRPHAEINAINKNKSKDLYNSSMYVSLEPCTHYGKTPPCTNTLIKKKFKKVFFSHTDEDKRTKNTAKNILEKKLPMNKNFVFSMIGISFFVGSNPLKADWDYWEIVSTGNSAEFDIFTVDVDTNEKTLRSTKQTDAGFTPASVYAVSYTHLTLPTKRSV